MLIEYIMAFVERVELKRLYYLQQIINENPKKCMDEWYNKETDKKKDNQSELNKVKKYVRIMIENQGTFSTTYHHSANSGGKYGRLFAYPSIQQLKGKVRGFLFYNYTDFDFKNCHPKILEYLCKKHKIICPNLSYYNEHRDEILDKAPDREARKIEFLKMTNSEYTRKHTDPFLKNYDKEMKQIQQHLISLPCYRDIVSCVPDTKKSNRNGSAMNHILCDYEAKLLEDMIQALIDNGFTPSVRMFDGCMIEGSVDNPEELLEKIEKYINSKYEDLNIQVTTKPHDQTIQLPEDYEIPTAIVESPSTQYPSLLFRT